MKKDKHKIQGTAIRLTGADRMFYLVVDIFMVFMLVVIAIPL